MDPNQLSDLAQRYQDSKDYITNEETTKSALVMPFIRLLGYDPNNPREVRPEYTAEFTHGDGKRHPDRMDFVIFDKTGKKPHMIIETKPLGTNLDEKSPQLARYISQMPNLRFGIITDGCHYLFFGDLDNRNQMDKNAFFRFSLDDPNADWSNVAKFLTRFGRDSFNTNTLVTDAEDSRYRQEMIEKLTKALKSPSDDQDFLKWLTEGIYKAKRTSGVLNRLGEVAKDAIEPALLKVISDEFIDKLQSQMLLARSTEGTEIVEGEETPAQDDTGEHKIDSSNGIEKRSPKRGIVTTEEELEFYGMIKQICTQSGFEENDIIYKDTVNYFNVSYKSPTKWFVRLFSGGRRNSIVTLVSVEEAKAMCEEFDVDEAPAVFGVSRVYIESVSQIWALKGLLLRSLEILIGGKSPD